MQVNHNIILKRFFKKHEDITQEQLNNHLEAEKNLEFVENYYESIQSNKITREMRRKLVQWMILLCDDLKVSFKTKQSATMLVDLVLSKMIVDKNYLQLLGITAIFIFIKCEESFQFTLSDAVYHCAEAYTEEHISLMETTILQVLRWKLHYSTPGEIARRLVYYFNSEFDLDLSKFFKSVDSYIDFCMSENDLSDFSPNTIAITAIILACEENHNLRDLFVKSIRGAQYFDFERIEYLFRFVIEEKNQHDVTNQSPSDNNNDECFEQNQNPNDETLDQGTNNNYNPNAQHMISENNGNFCENLHEQQNQYVTPPSNQNKNAKYHESLETTVIIYKDSIENSEIDEERYYS